MWRNNDLTVYGKLLEGQNKCEWANPNQLICKILANELHACIATTGYKKK